MTLELTRRSLLGAFAALLCVRPTPPAASSPSVLAAAPTDDTLFEAFHTANQLWVLHRFPSEMAVAPGETIVYRVDGHAWGSRVTEAGIVNGMWIPSNPEDEPTLNYLAGGGPWT